MTSYSAEQIEAIGGKPWQAEGGMPRVYLNTEVWAPMIGFEVDRYKSGNISHATLAGQKISNAKANALLRAKVYWENGLIWIDNGADIDVPLRAAIETAVAPTGQPTPEPVEQPAPRRGPVPLRFMLTLSSLGRMQGERGPRYLVSAQVRGGEWCAGYAADADAAEATRGWLDAESYRNAKVTAPEGSVDLEALGHTRRQAKEALDEATAVLRAGVLRAVEAGRAEAEVSRAAGVDRMTVRSWLGK